MNYKRNAKYFRKHPSWIPVILLVLLGSAIVYVGRKAEPRTLVDSDPPSWTDYVGSFKSSESDPLREPGPGLENRIKALVDGRFSEKELERITLAGAAVLLLAALLLLRLICWPRERTIDRVLTELHATLRERALKTLGIEEQEISRTDPIEFGSFEIPPSCAEDPKGRPLSPMVYGRDKRWRTPVCTVFGLYFSKTTVYYYCLTKSITSPAQREDTNEFWYSDIVSVKLMTKEVPAMDKNGKRIKNQTVRTDGFSLRNSSGETVSCVVRDFETAERAVTSMRSLLRETKNGGSEQELV